MRARAAHQLALASLTRYSALGGFVSQDELDQKRSRVSLDAQSCSFQAWAMDMAAGAQAERYWSPVQPELEGITAPEVVARTVEPLRMRRRPLDGVTEVADVESSWTLMLLDA